MELVIALALVGSTQGTGPLVLPPHSVPPAAIHPSPIARGPVERAAAQSYISRFDYPAEAGTAEGKVRFTLTISPDGRVIGCTIRQSSGSIALDRAACRIMERRARYLPALDMNGNPLVGTVAGEVDWKAH